MNHVVRRGGPVVSRRPSSKPRLRQPSAKKQRWQYSQKDLIEKAWPLYETTTIDYWVIET